MPLLIYLFLPPLPPFVISFYCHSLLSLFYCHPLFLSFLAPSPPFILSFYYHSLFIFYCPLSPLYIIFLLPLIFIIIFFLLLFIFSCPLSPLCIIVLLPLSFIFSCHSFYIFLPLLPPLYYLCIATLFFVFLMPLSSLSYLAPSPPLYCLFIATLFFIFLLPLFSHSFHLFLPPLPPFNYLFIANLIHLNPFLPPFIFSCPLASFYIIFSLNWAVSSNLDSPYPTLHSFFCSSPRDFVGCIAIGKCNILCNSAQMLGTSLSGNFWQPNAMQCSAGSIQCIAQSVFPVSSHSRLWASLVVPTKAKPFVHHHPSYITCSPPDHHCRTTNNNRNHQTGALVNVGSWKWPLGVVFTYHPFFVGQNWP